MIDVGQTVEPFTLPDQNGETVAWEQFRGQPVVVFFYPKASTPGCTREAQDFQAAASRFEGLRTRVVGISADTVKRQANFAAKYGLTMPLLADPERVVIEPWGVWQEKRNYGRTYMGIVRSTFLFDAEGRVVVRWSPVKVKGHVEAVLEAVQQHVGA